jgi:16S rRNA (uracil1498-N3)-methyltransferase
MDDELTKLPRLYVEQPLQPGTVVPLGDGPLHYFRTVLRRQTGDRLRVFNGRDGEFLAEITALDKKAGAITPRERIREQPDTRRKIQLAFAPIKKHRLDFLIEKAVELGVTNLHPVLTARTINRHINEERLRAQIVEAAEQCGRLDVPTLHGICNLKEKLRNGLPGGRVLWCSERPGPEPISIDSKESCAFIIGPEGGFDDEEAALLGHAPGIEPVSLGNTVYRAETAALVCLALAQAGAGPKK